MPGAKIENYTPAGTGYCTTIFGEFTVDLGGKIIQHKAGEIHIEEAGVPFTVWNEGTVPDVDRMFEVIWQ